jgi:hypothetical protein
MLKFSDYTDRISKAVHYHVENKIPLAENIYRLHSEEFYKLFREARELYRDEVLEVTSDWDKHLLETDIGEFGIYEGKEVPLDLPIEEEDKKTPPLNKPKRGGPKKFYVFVRDGDKIKKVTWGDTTGLSVKLKNPEARKSFAARKLQYDNELPTELELGKNYYINKEQFHRLHKGNGELKLEIKEYE